MGRVANLLFPVLAINVAYTCYGVSVVVLRFFGKALNPMTYLTVRSIAAVPLLFMAAAIAERAKPARPKSLREAVMVFVIGVNVALNSALGVSGVMLAGAAIGAVLFMTVPVSGTLFAIVTRTEKTPSLREKKGIAKLGGIFITVVGAIMLVLGGEKHDAKTNGCEGLDDNRVFYTSDYPALGITLCVLCVVFSGVYFVITKRFFMKYKHWKSRPTSSTAWVNLASVVTFLAISPVATVLPNHDCSGNRVEVVWADMWQIPGESIYAVEYATVFTTCVALMLMTWTLTRLPASVTSAFMPVGQMIGVGLAAAVLGEQLTVLQYGATVFIIAGLLAVVWAQYQEEKIGRRRSSESLADEEASKHVGKDPDRDSLEELSDMADLNDVKIQTLGIRPMKILDFEQPFEHRETFRNDDQLPLTEYEESEEVLM